MLESLYMQQWNGEKCLYCDLVIESLFDIAVIVSQR